MYPSIIIILAVLLLAIASWLYRLWREKRRRERWRRRRIRNMGHAWAWSNIFGRKPVKRLPHLSVDDHG